jgi:ribosome-associated toxin RatA of RatAB toxin-antitoxin module
MTRRVVAPIAAALVSAAACAAHGQAEFSVEAQRDGDAVEVRVHALLDASAALTWQVISDYERLPEFVPGISRSVVVARSGNRVTLEQSGEARFAFLVFPIEVRLEVLESPLEWIVSRAVSGNVRRMSGRYEIHPEGARGGVTLRYHGAIEPAFELPPIVGVAALRWTIEQQFEAMVNEILRQAAARPREN